MAVAAKNDAVSAATSEPGSELVILYEGYLYLIYSGGYQY